MALMASCNGNQIYETTIHTTEAEKDAIILQATDGTTETMIQETTSSKITPVVSSKEESYLAGSSLLCSLNRYFRRDNVCEGLTSAKNF